MASAPDSRIDHTSAKIATVVNRAVPGLLLAIFITVCAWGIAGLTGLPGILLALLFGLVAQPFLRGDTYESGLEIAARKLLRVGVALLGAGVVASDIAALGWPVLVLCLIGVAFTLAVGCVSARILRSDTASGLLFGGAVAICGASAALAISAALPQTRENESKTLLAVLGVTALSTAAMVLYPLIATQLEMTDKAAGVFFGATIHDVAQVVGAGYMISDTAGETATMVKLVRVACLVPVVAIIAYLMSSKSGACADEIASGRVNILPVFLIGFVALSIVASSGLVPPLVLEGLASAGKALLVLAIAALGCLTSLQSIWRIGWTPVILLVIPTLALAAFALLAVISFSAFH